MKQPDFSRSPALKTIAMPADANPDGDIFGGWMLSQMDLAGSIAAQEHCHGRVATVAVEAMTFHRPIFIGDEVSCYAHLKKVGRTSMTVEVVSWVRRKKGGDYVQVTEGNFIYVAIDENRSPRPVPPMIEQKESS